MVKQDTVSIRLADIEAATAVVRLDAGILTRDYLEYLAVAEDLNLRIIEIVHQNAQSSLPRTGAADSRLPAGGRGKPEVEAKLEVWRQGEGLPFPDLSEEEKRS